MLSFHVTRRTHELGVRMALGASRRSVLALMLSMGGRLVLIGLAVGVPVSLASTRLLRSQLFGVQAADPLSYAAVALLLGSVALAACYLPARRAAGVDPMLALGRSREAFSCQLPAASLEVGACRSARRYYQGPLADYKARAWTIQLKLKLKS